MWRSSTGQYRPPAFWLAALVACCSAGLNSAFAEQPTPERLRFFETRIRPMLADNCYRCHGPERQRGDLRLDSAQAMRRGGSSSVPIVVPASPEKSLLIKAVRHQLDDLKMPPDKKLTAAQIADLTRWVQAGAFFPEPVATTGNRQHWAFQKPGDPPLPTVQNIAWPHAPLDHFVLAALDAKGLQPAPPAERRTLIRRATFDLLGLPPTPEEVDAFVNDSAPDAFRKVVERLLASPHYGERWARHWLDVARYADSNGLDENVAFGNAWRYRDYVVAAFNSDKPYDQFLLEQIAGDLLPSRDASARRDQLIATAFLALGPKVLAEVDAKKMEMDILDEQVDTLGRSVLALTLGCARCHHHKFDPLSMEDYYGLVGIFQSSKSMENYIKIARWHENPLGGAAETAMGFTEGKIGNAVLLRRGNHLTPGDVVPRRLPAVLVNQQPAFGSASSGRLELARWLVAPEHPLTSRVMVNRVWRWHFGRGLVASTDNFGELGDRPDNQPLLDWLAHRFRESGWSIKSLHRLIMLSSTYQMSSTPDSRAAEIDPENRLHWRANLRRLEAETIRDNLLAVSGLLDRTMGGSMLHVKNRAFLFDHTSKDGTRYDSRRRTLYLPVIRNNLYDVFQLFDATDATVINGNRSTTTVATQALFMMNSDLVAEAAKNLASQLLARNIDDPARVQQLYRQAYGRPPTTSETARMLDAAREFEQSTPNRGDVERRLHAWTLVCHITLAANEFVYVD